MRANRQFKKHLSLILAAILTATAAGAAQILDIGDPEVCGTAGVRPSIDVDSKGQPHILIDTGHIVLGNTLYMFNKINGHWRDRVFATRTSEYPSPSAISQPWIEIDAKDRAWIYAHYFRAGSYENSGQGLWLYSNMDESPSKIGFTLRHYGPQSGWGPGNVQIDPNYVDQCVVMAFYGHWGIVNDQGTDQFDNGGFPTTGIMGPTDTGEKFRFRITPREGQRGVWHGVMNGCRAASDSSYHNSIIGRDVVWASYYPYSSQGDDHNHAGVCGDLDKTDMGYMAAVFEPQGLCMNIWDGSEMIFPTTNLLQLDPNAKFVHRYAPSMTSALGGGCWIAWPDHHGYIKMAHVSQEGVVEGPRTIGKGSYCAINTDAQGQIHMAYVEGSQTKYRKILVSAPIDLIEPDGRTYDRTPTFTWDPFEGTTDLTLYYWPKGAASGHTRELEVTGTSHTISSELGVGRWEWMMTGMYDGSLIESQVESFHIPPEPPQPAAPAKRFGTGNDTPAFSWDDPEDSPWYHVQIRKYGSVGISSEVVESKWTRKQEWTPSSGLGNGSFSWHVYAFDGRHSPGIYSDWSNGMDFQIGVPSETSFVSPASNLVYTNTTPIFAWEPAASETNDAAYTWYQLYVIRDGRIINDVDRAGSGWFTENPDGGAAALTQSNGNLQTSTDIGALKPGEYSLWLRPVDSVGAGPWAGPHQFLVNRRMTPGAEGAELGFGTSLDPASGRRPDFTWTGDDYAAWYNMKLVKDGEIVADSWSQTPSWQPESDLENGNYRWWVRAYNFGTGYASSWLQPAALQMAIPAKSKLLAPSGVQTNNPPVFEWSEASGAEGYKLWYQQVGDTNTRVSVTTSNTFHTPAGALDAGQYRWWIGSSNQYEQVWNEDYMEFEIQ